LTRLAQLAAPRIERLSDLGPLLGFLFSGRLALSAEEFRGGKLEDLTIRQAFTLALSEFDAQPAWTPFAIEIVIKRIAEALEQKTRDLARPFYVAITGSPTSIPLYDSMDLLGRDIVRERLRGALELLGAPTEREKKAWQSLLSEREVAV
jgi:glutamyl-tRNA synthetase